MKTIFLLTQVLLLCLSVYSIFRVFKCNSFHSLSKTRYDGILIMIVFYLFLIFNVSFEGGFSIKINANFALNCFGLLFGVIILFVQNLIGWKLTYQNSVSKLNVKKNGS